MSIYNAYDEVLNAIGDETVEGIVFGEWGQGEYREDGEIYPVPPDKQNIVLTLEQARPYMQDWRISDGYGSPDCHAMYVWTDKNVYWIAKYDGATWLDSMPRQPINCVPDMSGGG